jgi:hypothetical protein
MLRRIGSFVVAAAFMLVFGSATHSYLVQRAWSVAAGQAGGTGPVAIPLADRVSWAVHDLAGMLLPYASTTSAALLVAFVTAGAVVRFSGHRPVVFGVAGAFAIFALFTGMKFLLGTVGIFGARGMVGLASQMAVGSCAGLVFAKLTPQS